jgi:hypothetical protein
MNDLDFDLGLALSVVAPGKKWRLVGNSFDGLQWMDEAAQPTETELRNGLLAHNTALANRKVWPNGEAFLRELTLEELAAISLSTDPTIAALRLLLVARQAEVWSDDQELNFGLSRAVQLNLLTLERKTVILTK